MSGVLLFGTAVPSNVNTNITIHFGYTISDFGVHPKSAISKMYSSTSNTNILGVFKTTNTKTKHIEKIVIECEKGTYFISTHVACKYKVCSWGKVRLKTIGKNTYQAMYTQGLSTILMTITQKGKQLTVTTKRTYKDSRPPSQKKDVLTLSKKLSC